MGDMMHMLGVDVGADGVNYLEMMGVCCAFCLVIARISSG
jgi:hypothetical protein